MFSGIVQTVGQVEYLSSDYKLKVVSKEVAETVKVSDSVAVNGVCLTVVEKGADFFISDLVPETRNKSNLIYLKAKSGVNLEASLNYGDPIGGHLVSGHVSGLGVIKSLKPDQNAINLCIASDLTARLKTKGFVAVDGMSLTINAIKQDQFSLSLIPHTVEKTIAKDYEIGHKVNLELSMETF